MKKIIIGVISSLVASMMIAPNIFAWQSVDEYLQTPGIVTNIAKEINSYPALSNKVNAIIDKVNNSVANKNSLDKAIIYEALSRKIQMFVAERGYDSDMLIYRVLAYLSWDFDSRAEQIRKELSGNDLDKLYEALNQLFQDEYSIGNNLPKDWVVYNNEILGLKFGYPKDWFVREEITEYNNRIYIENQENKNYNIGTYPKDFLGMWIDYRRPTSETLSYEEQIKEFDSMSAKKEIIDKSLEIHTYEFGYNPNGERSGAGPYLEAVWYNNSWIYIATTMSSDDKENNEKKVATLKKILTTLEFDNILNNSNWNYYENKKLGISINYPQEWVYEDSNDAIYFGTPESRTGGYIWGIFINQPNEIEKLIAQQGSQFEDRKESRSEIVVNKNITGTMVTVTTNKYDDWILKNIYFEHDGKLFIISNGAIDDDKFKIFYESLKFSN